MPLKVKRILAPTCTPSETVRPARKGTWMILGKKFIHSNAVNAVHITSIVIYNAGLFFITSCCSFIALTHLIFNNIVARFLFFHSQRVILPCIYPCKNTKNAWFSPRVSLSFSKISFSLVQLALQLLRSNLRSSFQDLRPLRRIRTC